MAFAPCIQCHDLCHARLRLTNSRRMKTVAISPCPSWGRRLPHPHAAICAFLVSVPGLRIPPDLRGNARSGHIDISKRSIRPGRPYCRQKLAGSSLQFSQSRLNKKLMLILQLVTCACWALPAPLKDNRDVGTRTTTQAGSFGSYFFDCVCCLTVPAFQAAAANALQAMIPPLSHLWTNLCQSPQLQPFARVETRRFHRVLTLKRLASG